MQDADKIKQRIREQLEVAKVVNSDFITLTTDEGKDLLYMVKSPLTGEEQGKIMNALENSIEAAKNRKETNTTVPVSLLANALDYINYLLLPF